MIVPIRNVYRSESDYTLSSLKVQESRVQYSILKGMEGPIRPIASPEDELAYLREQIMRKEAELASLKRDTSREDIEKNLTLIRTEAARIKSEAEAVRAKMDMLVSLCGNVIGFAVMVKTSIDKAAQ